MNSSGQGQAKCLFRDFGYDQGVFVILAEGQGKIGVGILEKAGYKY